MLLSDSPAILLLALGIEAALGYPDRVYRVVGHPVTWIGRLVAALDRFLNLDSVPAGSRRLAGIAALAMVIGVTAIGALALVLALSPLGAGGAVVLAFVASTLLAQRSLQDHVARVAAALRSGGLGAGRVAVGDIVGRNPAALDEAAICRAAIESLAENFSDGVVAPAFWFAVASLPGAAVYKAVNTADSMIGHRTPRHEAFGWAAARLDDLLNLPASRLSAALIALAAAIEPGASAAVSWRAVLRDARRHRSPNAGWPEAAMAGALGLALAGPRVYGTTRVEDAWMGEGRADASPADIDRALALYRRACRLLWALVAVIAGLIFLVSR